MKIIFILSSPKISGGTNVILQHAAYMQKNDCQVFIACDYPKAQKEAAKWHSKANIVEWVRIEEAAEMEFDIAIATWWKTVFNLHKIQAKHYCYLVQSIESFFYPNNNQLLKQLADSTYALPIHIITIAKWLKDHIREYYNVENIGFIRNGIQKEIYNLNGPCISPRSPNKLRILIEGPIDVSFKNVPKTIELCKRSLADEIWLLTSSNITNYEGVDRVFSCVPIEETAKIYRSCDAIVKLSYVEGMFGPPLEMFHCGGTSITYNVTGHDEYIINDYNGIVIKKDFEDDVVNSINNLKNDKNYLDFLKKNAIKTAEEWVSWNESSAYFLKEMQLINTQYNDPRTRSFLKNQGEALMNLYALAYVKQNHIYKVLLNKFLTFIRNKFPNLYNIFSKTVILRKIYNKLNLLS